MGLSAGFYGIQNAVPCTDMIIMYGMSKCSKLRADYFCTFHLHKRNVGGHEQRNQFISPKHWIDMKSLDIIIIFHEVLVKQFSIAAVDRLSPWHEVHDSMFMHSKEMTCARYQGVVKTQNLAFQRPIFFVQVNI